MSNKPRNHSVKKPAVAVEKPLSAAQEASPPATVVAEPAAKAAPAAAKSAKPTVAKSAKPTVAKSAKPTVAKTNGTKPAAKPAAAKPVAAPAAKAEAKPAAKPEPVVPVAAVVSEAPAKSKKDGKKAKLVRDSFTLPENDYVLFASMKARCLALGVEAKKSELLRAALRQLSGLDDAMLVAVMSQIEKIKTGRPAS